VETKNIIVLLTKMTTVTRLTVCQQPTVCQHERVKLTPHVSQLMVEGVDRVLLSNRADKLQDEDVERVALRLVELHRTLPYHSSGR
jgi:hypothetical protein